MNIQLATTALASATNPKYFVMRPFNADAAGNGCEVLEALEKIPYDVVLMDCHMPEMDGYEATRAIRRHPALASAYIIAMTANAMQGDREKCLESGMDDYVAKPTRISDLETALQKAIAHLGEPKIRGNARSGILSA